MSKFIFKYEPDEKVAKYSHPFEYIEEFDEDTEHISEFHKFCRHLAKIYGFQQADIDKYFGKEHENPLLD